MSPTADTTDTQKIRPITDIAAAAGIEPDELGLVVAEHGADTLVPRRRPPVGIESENGVVPHLPDEPSVEIVSVHARSSLRIRRQSGPGWAVPSWRRHLKREGTSGGRVLAVSVVTGSAGDRSFSYSPHAPVTS